MEPVFRRSTFFPPKRRSRGVYWSIFAPARIVLATYTAPVVRIADGDTITVLHDRQRVRIRLWGIDAPEMAQAWGPEAKQFTAARVEGQTVTLQVHDTDRYGRTVAEVILPDERTPVQSDQCCFFSGGKKPIGRFGGSGGGSISCRRISNTTLNLWSYFFSISISRSASCLCVARI